MDIVDEIMEKDCSKGTRIVELVAVSQLNYRTPLGQKAWDAVGSLTDADTMVAISTLVGFCTAVKSPDWEHIISILK